MTGLHGSSIFNFWEDSTLFYTVALQTDIPISSSSNDTNSIIQASPSWVYLNLITSIGSTPKYIGELGFKHKNLGKIHTISL